MCFWKKKKTEAVSIERRILVINLEKDLKKKAKKNLPEFAKNKILKATVVFKVTSDENFDYKKRIKESIHYYDTEESEF